MKYCEVLQGSIFALLLFLAWIHDPPCPFNILNPIMFAGDTNLFHEHKNITKVFATVNEDLKNFNDWFILNKLFLLARQTAYKSRSKN